MGLGVFGEALTRDLALLCKCVVAVLWDSFAVISYFEKEDRNQYNVEPTGVGLFTFRNSSDQVAPSNEK